MSNVRSAPLKSSRPAGALAGGCVSVVGAVFGLVSIGPLIILLNGGYSIVGMAWLANHTGEYGKLFWALASTATLDVPIAAKAGLPVAQPVLPWIFVVGTSFLQIGLIIRRLRRLSVDPFFDGLGTAVSIFDYITTAAGLVFALGLAGALLYAWAPFAIALAIPLTFGFEAMVARILKGR
jgi:hypothetical protein